jgi:hypothetical protein
VCGVFLLLLLFLLRFPDRLSAEILHIERHLAAETGTNFASLIG